MIFGIGNDVMEIKRMKKAMERNPKIMERLFTEQEIQHYRKKNMEISFITGGYSAKQAVLKSLGTGIGVFRWKDIEILRYSTGRAVAKVHGGVKNFVEENGIGTIHVSISHSPKFVAATAVAELSLESEGHVLESLLFVPDPEDRRSVH